MNSIMRKSIFVIAVLCAMLMICAMGIAAAEEVTIVQSGSCGTNLTYQLDNEGTLTISGTGKMQDFYSFSPVPWDSVSRACM